MTFRAVVQDGLIVINTHGAIPDGTRVEVLPVAERSKPAAKPRAARSSKKAKEKPGKDLLPGFGSWKHRTDIKDTAEYVRGLRRRTSRRLRNA